MNQTQAMAAVCEIELNNGSNCGVQAIGRCSTCGRAFCLTHQAQNLSGVVFVGYVSVGDPGMCTSCQEAVQAPIRKEQEEIRKEQEEWRAAVEYFKSGAAQTDLLASGVQSVEIFRIEHKFKKVFLGLGGRYIVEVSSFGRGWLVGESQWQFPWQDSPQDHLIILPDHPLSELIEVGPYLGGYVFQKYIDLSWAPDPPHKWTIAAAQAVKRLVGTSN
jgi:hypothetical protein